MISSPNSPTATNALAISVSYRSSRSRHRFSTPRSALNPRVVEVLLLNVSSSSSLSSVGFSSLSRQLSISSVNAFFKLFIGDKCLYFLYSNDPLSRKERRRRSEDARSPECRNRPFYLQRFDLFHRFKSSSTYRSRCPIFSSLRRNITSRFQNFPIRLLIFSTLPSRFRSNSRTRRRLCAFCGKEDQSSFFSPPISVLAKPSSPKKKTSS